MSKQAFMFISGMLKAGYELDWYFGYGNYSGPSVRVDSLVDIQDVIRATSVKVKWDTLGRGEVVYPSIGLRLPSLGDKILLVAVDGEDEDGDEILVIDGDGEEVGYMDVSECEGEFEVIDRGSKGRFYVRRGDGLLLMINPLSGNMWRNANEL